MHAESTTSTAITPSTVAPLDSTKSSDTLLVGIVAAQGKPFGWDVAHLVMAEDTTAPEPHVAAIVIGDPPNRLYVSVSTDDASASLIRASGPPTRSEGGTDIYVHEYNAYASVVQALAGPVIVRLRTDSSQWVITNDQLVAIGIAVVRSWPLSAS